MGVSIRLFSLQQPPMAVVSLPDFVAGWTQAPWLEVVTLFRAQSNSVSNSRISLRAVTDNSPLSHRMMERISLQCCPGPQKKVDANGIWLKSHWFNAGKDHGFSVVRTASLVLRVAYHQGLPVGVISSTLSPRKLWAAFYIIIFLFVLSCHPFLPSFHSLSPSFLSSLHPSLFLRIQTFFYYPSSSHSQNFMVKTHNSPPYSRNPDIFIGGLWDFEIFLSVEVEVYWICGFIKIQLIRLMPKIKWKCGLSLVMFWMPH